MIEAPRDSPGAAALLESPYFLNRSLVRHEFEQLARQGSKRAARYSNTSGGRLSQTGGP